MKGWIILAQVRSELPISPKGHYLAKLTVTVVYQLYSFMLQHFKKSSKRKWWDRRLYNFGLNWVRVTSLKKNFLGPAFPWTNYCIPSCYVISKKLSQRRSWEKGSIITGKWYYTLFQSLYYTILTFSESSFQIKL